jgi:hypothetical protein
MGLPDTGIDLEASAACVAGVGFRVALVSGGVLVLEERKGGR